MATTTNYGWTTPDDTALVKDGAAAIRTLGSSIDTTLKTQIDAQIPDTLLTTTGDVIYASAANTPARLGIGTTGQVLTVAGGVPSWVAPSGSVPAGNFVSTTETTTSTSYTDLTTVQSVTLTTGTKAAISLTTYAGQSGNTNETYISVAVSGATTLAASDTNSLRYKAPVATAVFTLGGTMYISGLTAGSNTFTMKFRVQGGTGTFQSRSIIVENLGS
jgi:hypothetical protein